MKINRKQETWIWLIILLPVVYLLIIWKTIPETVPTHFDINGNIDDWGSKNSLWIMPVLIQLPLYILLLIVPAIDPKQKIRLMRKKYFTIRIAITIFLTILSIYIIYISTHTAVKISGSVIFVLTGILFAILGNLMPATRSNYFVGIRTPWTLHSDTIWIKTNRLAGKMMFAAGILMVVTGLFIPARYTLFSTVIVVFGALLSTIVPAIYSYLLWKKEQNNQNSGENDKT